MKIRWVFFAFALYFIPFSLYQVFRGAIILPQTFSLGLITIRYYGLFMALAVAIGFYLAVKRSSQYGLGTKQAEDILFYIIVGGFIGARLYHVLSSSSYYASHPLDIFKVWNGGLSIYGVIIGGIVTLLGVRKIFNFQFSIFKILNWLTPSLLLGQIIGRFGNFFNYELYGYPTNLPWKMFVPAKFREQGFIDYSFFHPLFLYEQIGLIIIALIIGKVGSVGLFGFKNKLFGQTGTIDPSKVIRNNKEKSNGVNLFFWYLLLYNILRFVLEFIRVDSVFWGNLRINALVSFILVCISAGVIYGKHKRQLAS